MFATITKSSALSSKVMTAVRSAPRFSSALLHTQPVYQDGENEDTAPINALGARLGLSLDTNVLKQALTHKSVEGSNNNATLEYIGKRVTGLFATEYIHSRFPQLHPGAFNTTLRAYIGNKSFSKIATEVGMQHTVDWKAPEDDSVKLGHARVLADCMNALVGAIYQEQGQEAAKKFIHDFVLSRDFDVRPGIKVQEPKRHLSILMKQLNKQPAVSRLLSETGRHSSAPVFVVGVFSGENKLGEGFGSSLKMAEFRACQDALTSYYGQEYKDFTLPSDAENVDKYVANPLGNTQAIV
ncbi:ribonuclease III [Mucor ambiguus]|uniref:Large ribosomal subunit protein mL44 n=1 Tax=Mucor ambiguus TaxID=91626 RepID=A0A0C9LRV7_9FUNG|nr:ribonuclease III [Mucor ambiguus]